MAADEQRAAQSHAPVTDADDEAPAAAPPAGVHQIAGLLQELARKSSSKADRAEFEELLAKTQPVLDYMEQQPAIEAASCAIEAHRADFDKLVGDGQAYLQRTSSLFAEERFVPLRFTADEVQRAFDKVGPLPPDSSNDQFVKIVRKAILHLANKERRSQSAMSLLMYLPDLVAANRPLDAWILQQCACLTGEDRDQSNPFLFQMFSYGYEDWVAQQRSRDAAMFRQLGMDLSRLEGMSMDEVDAWLQEQQADPAKRARMAQVLLANPEQRAQAEANLQLFERDAHKLLEREDAAHLLLSPRDIQPWLPRMNECLASVCEQFPDAVGPSPSSVAGTAFMEAVFPLIGEMLAELFTPDRIQQLTAGLKAYRNERHAAGDKQVTMLANSAIVSLAEERDPATNPFLYSLGFISLMTGLEASAGPAQEQAPPADEKSV